MSGKNKIGVVRLRLDCDVGAFAIEFHEDDGEVTGICSVNTLLDPGIQLFDGARKKLMERKVLIALAFGIETRKTLPGHDVALEATNLALVQELFTHSVLAAGVSARSWCPYELLTVETCEEICSLSFKGIAFGFAGAGHGRIVSWFPNPRRSFHPLDHESISCCILPRFSQGRGIQHCICATRDP